MSNESSNDSVFYQHTQKSPLFFVLVFFAGIFLILSLFGRLESSAVLILSLVGAIFMVLSCSFYSLSTSIRDNRLHVRYGPIPLFGTSFDLSSIDQVSVDSTWVLDGWGIHYVPFRGWTMNLWGFSCVKIQMGNRVVRIGTDDAERLAEQINKAKG